MQGGSSIIWLIGLFALMYFMMIRPQQKQKKKRDELLNNVAQGDKIVTVGGIHGTIASLTKDTMMLEIAPKLLIKMQRSSIGLVETDEEADVESVEELDTDSK